MTSTVRRVLAPVTALFAAVALSLAGPVAAQASGIGSVTVTVTENGMPAVSVFVAVGGPDFNFAQTDSSGTATITDLALGDYSLDISSTTQLQGINTTFSLTSTAPTYTATLALVPWPVGTGSIAVTLVDSVTAAPVAGAHVAVNQLDQPSGGGHDGTTDENGVYTATGLVAGLYRLGTDATPDYLGGYAEVQVADGATASTTIHLLAADSTITGRVVDPDGNGVAGLYVSASISAGQSGGYISGQTDPDGYYTLDDAAAGTWDLFVYPDTNWERATGTVLVAAGSTATAADLVLVPRFTGTIGGQVASSDGIAETIGGFFDVCATVLQPDGTPVPEQSMVTGGDSFYYFWLAPGQYTVRFDDCNPTREPHGYQSVYLGGSPTLAGATIVTVETLVDLSLDTTVLPANVGNPMPGHDATPVAKNKLKAATKNLIHAPSDVRVGDTVTVSVGAQHAGEWMSAWVYSSPLQLGGWQQVAPDGTISVVIPSNSPLGTHRLSVQDATDHVVGWTKIEIKKPKKVK